MVVIHGKNFNYIRYRPAYMKKLLPSYANKLLCLIDTTKPDPLFSLVDYRNNYFTSDDPNKIIEFYNGFENRDQLIQWMKERPKGVAAIHEVEGDKEIIVVIPTADFNGQYARECRENIFKGLQIIFVESGGRWDFYFNFSHNVNVGIKKAMEYNPKWIVVSNDDMYKIDDVDVLTNELKNINNEEVDIVYTPPSVLHCSPERVAKRNILFTPYYFITNKNYGRITLNLIKKFKTNYFCCRLDWKCTKILKKGYEYIEINTFFVISPNWIRSTNDDLFDEIYINHYLDLDLSIRLSINKHRARFIGYKIGDYISSTLGINKARDMRNFSGIVYFNFKMETILDNITKR